MLQDHEIIDITKYMLDNNTTIRQTAEHFKCGRNKIHYAVTKLLPKISHSLDKRMQKLLVQNKKNATIRGGAATARFWASKKPVKIVAIVLLNDGYAYVLDKQPQLEYERHGKLLIGSDSTNTFYDVLQYGACGGDRTFGGNYAFGGRKFYLPMKDGTQTYCYGQWWSGGVEKAVDLLGVDLIGLTYNTRKKLKNCYVYCGGLIDKQKKEVLLRDYYSRSSNAKIWGYTEYEKQIKKNKPKRINRKEWE